MNSIIRPSYNIVLIPVTDIVVSLVYSTLNIIVCNALFNLISSHYSWSINYIHLPQLGSGRLIVLASSITNRGPLLVATLQTLPPSLLTSCEEAFASASINTVNKLSMNNLLPPSLSQQMTKLAFMGFYEYARLISYGSVVYGFHDLNRVAIVREGNIVVTIYQVWIYELRADDACKLIIKRQSIPSITQYSRLQSPL